LAYNQNKKGSSAILGAAFLMATSAIGPGFLTQTTVFTEQLKANFAFVILITILLDIVVQLNIWRILSISSLRAQDLANQLLPGLGYILAALIILGGIAFNIGNIAGCGLGINVLTGLDVNTAAVISGIVALAIFWLKEAVTALDGFTKILGILMILLTLYVSISSQPPLVEAALRSVYPRQFDATAIVTLIGGTVGGYISFAGAHRLLDAGVTGTQNLPQINRSAISGIVITGVMRTILFLAALGVVVGGGILDKTNPAASVFQIAAGNIGYKFFGVVMWSAAITSVVGAAYTSVSFIKTFHPWLQKNQQLLVSIFIILSTIIFVLLGKPVQLLVIAGALNGLILPVALAVILIASHKKNLMGTYKHPHWLRISGWLVVGIMLWLSIIMIEKWLG
jgi:Mn2+/Fe2+ NRAMP family transporter